ncbi:hypothetical protein GJ744_007942 [Endocarpon pusillum]|uniref:Uncharacterized protein n=1 Tax=Endocarpon pusillum TaxID=364733 RepID=A0A8H7AMB5_9EURO|nr:hypothetical protein GJ744_007942 [Endocarpon pusillum]
MALTWNNEPAGSGLHFNCLQHSPCLCQPPNSFLSRSTDHTHIASAENLSLAELKASPAWSAPLWLSSLRQIIAFRFSPSKTPSEAYSYHRNTASTVPANTTKYQQIMPPKQTQKAAAVASSSTPTGSVTMTRKCSRESSPSSPTSRKSLRLSPPVLRSELEGRRPKRQSISPQSSGISTLSSPPDSDKLDDPVQEERVESSRPSLKRKAHEDHAPLYQTPNIRAAAKYQVPDKKRKVHLLVEDDQDVKASDPVAHGPRPAFLPGLDTPFELVGQSILAKTDGSREQKAWSRKYISARDGRREVLRTTQSALGPELGGSRASTPASFVSNTPSKRGRGSGRRGRGRGRGGRGRGGGRTGRNEDSPEPPKKKILTEEEKEILARLKARQTELKKFFKDVAAQQNQSLHLLTTRDLTKLARKSKAHEKVPEYQVLLDDLGDKKQDAEDFARRKYEYDLQQANLLLEAETEVIERRFRTRCEEAKSEHHAAARGDCLIAMEAIQAMIDDNRTEAGSPDQTCFPHFNTLAQPGMVRGYYSQHVTDETSLRRPLSSFDDTIRHAVLDHGLVSPTLFEGLDLARAHQTKDISQHAHDSSTVSSPLESNPHPTLSFQALADEATRRLEESNNVMTPITPQATQPQPATVAKPPQQDPNLGSWPLSRLADAAEHESTRRNQQVRQNNHIFPPPPPRMVPINPFQPWLGFMPEVLPLAPPHHQPQICNGHHHHHHHPPPPPPPPPPPAAAAAAAAAHSMTMPPLPPNLPITPYSSLPPLHRHHRRRRRRRRSSSSNHPSVHQRQPQPRIQPQPQPQQRQQQPQRLNMPSYPIQQQPHRNRQPVTFVNHTLHVPHPMSAPAPAKSRNGGSVADGGLGAVGAGAGAGAGAGGPRPPPKGGQRLLLPKKSSG